MADDHTVNEQPAERDASADSPPLSPQRLDPTIYLLALLTVVVLSLAYFFIIFLPARYKTLETSNQDLALRKQQTRQAFQACVDSAETQYENYIKRNGTPVATQPGAYAAPDHIWDTAERNRQAALDTCARLYPH